MFKMLSLTSQQVSDSLFLNFILNLMPEYMTLQGDEYQIASQVKKNIELRFREFFIYEQKRFEDRAQKINKIIPIPIEPVLKPIKPKKKIIGQLATLAESVLFKLQNKLRKSDLIWSDGLKLAAEDHCKKI